MIGRSVTVCTNLPAKLTITEIEFTEKMIVDKIYQLRPNSAPGPDDILKDYINGISYPLKLIFETSMQTSSVPQDWRLANVSPIF